MSSKCFTELVVWQKAHQFVLDVYKYTCRFPKEELFGLVSQLRRAAGSIPANIAEGYKKTGQLDKAKFINIAQGSLEECRYYLILSGELGYGENMVLQEALDEVGRILYSYRAAILS